VSDPKALGFEHVRVLRAEFRGPDGLLCFHAGRIPVDDVHELPGILAELKLKLAVLVDYQL